jgi:methyl-accepting chemotaxis protein
LFDIDYFITISVAYSREVANQIAEITLGTNVMLESVQHIAQTTAQQSKGTEDISISVS